MSGKARPRSETTQLRVVDARYRALLSSTRDALLVENDARQVSEVNEHFCAFFGIPASPESMRGVDCEAAARAASALFADPVGFLSQIEVYLAARRPVFAEHLPLLDGRVVERDFVPIDDADGNAAGCVWRYRLVRSSRARANQPAPGSTDPEPAAALDTLRASERLKAGILETALDCIITIDHTGVITEWNPACERTFGWSREEVLGREMATLILPDGFVEPHRAGLARNVSTGDATVLGKRLELSARRRDGQVFPCELSIVRIEGGDGHMPVYTGFLRDITERREAEEELQDAMRAAAAANEAKSRFLATMSHEVRTPLNAILGFSELLGDVCAEPEHRQWLATVQTAAESLLVMIDEILDVTRIENDQLELDPQPFELRATLDQTLALLRLKSEERGLALRSFVESSVPDQVIGDANRLRQVIINLVGNAIKFTEEGSVSLFVTVDRAGSDRPTLRFVVEDTGIGMSSDQLERIFDRFYQVESSDRRRHGGVGLGLAISHSIVALMGGQLAASSRPGIGSRFEFTVDVELPAADQRAETDAWNTKTDFLLDHPTRSGKLLLAEDNAANREVALRFLTLAGYDVHCVSDGAQAAAAVREGSFDLVLMDVQMPVLDGLAATERVREHERNTGGRIPVVALTAHAIPGVRERCLAAGMDDYLTKPLRRDALLETVSLHLSARAHGLTLEPELTTARRSATGDHRPGASTIPSRASVIAPRAAPASDGPVFSIDLVDEDLYDLVSWFLEERKRDLAKLRLLIDQPDFEAIRVIGHSLKGSGASYGFAGLSALGGELQTAAEAQRRDLVSVLIRRMAHDLDRVQLPAHLL